MKVEMQILHMSEDSQTRVVKALAELHGGQYQMKNAKSYKDTGHRYQIEQLYFQIYI